MITSHKVVHPNPWKLNVCPTWRSHFAGMVWEHLEMEIYPGFPGEPYLPSGNSQVVGMAREPEHGTWEVGHEVK